MKSVSFSAEALAEIRSARKWYEGRSPEAAARFVDAIEEAVQRIGEVPRSFVRVPLAGSDAELRRARLRTFPYSLVFLERRRSVTIIAIAHDKRRPLYWLARIKDLGGKTERD
ncbi:MAG: type II toxin-antitoxin system RelE/ParE family toxin [Polyangiales bacterium]